jgi:uncharacterized membrane protein
MPNRLEEIPSLFKTIPFINAAFGITGTALAVLTTTTKANAAKSLNLITSLLLEIRFLHYYKFQTAFSSLGVRHQ